MRRAGLRKIYVVFRSIVFSLLLMATGLYVGLYVALSLPAVQRRIGDAVENAFNERSPGRLKIDRVEISPFSEAVLTGVHFIDPQGEEVVSAGTVGAGINLFRLVFYGEVQLTYAELISLDAHIVQPRQDAPLNIQFIIDAFSSKEKKAPSRFDLRLENVVVRLGSVTFDRAWKAPLKDPRRFDPDHFRVSRLSADLRFPRLRNDDFIVDLRRLSFSEAKGLDVNSISGKFHLTRKELTFNNLSIRLPGTELRPDDMTLRFNGYEDIPAALRRETMRLRLVKNTVTPSDFRAFAPVLSHYTQSYLLTLDVLRKGDDLRLDALRITSATGLSLSASGVVKGALGGDTGRLAVRMPSLELHVSGAEAGRIIEDFSPLSGNVNSMLAALGDIDLSAALTASSAGVECDGRIDTSAGNLVLSGSVEGLDTAVRKVRGKVATSGLALRRVVPSSPVEEVRAEATLDAVIAGKEFAGSLDAVAPLLVINGRSYANLEAHIVKEGNSYSGEASIADTGLAFDISGRATLAGAASSISFDADVEALDLARLKIASLPAAQFSGYISADLQGGGVDDMRGVVEGYGLDYSDARYGSWHLDNLRIESLRDELPYTLSLDCDYLTADLRGDFALTRLPDAFLSLLSRPLPDLVPANLHPLRHTQNCRADITLYKDTELTRRLNLPVTLLEDLRVSAAMNTDEGTASLDVNVPYLQQGRDKLIRDTALSFTLDNESDLCNLSLSTRLPGKKGLTTLMLEANAADNRIDTDLAWDMERRSGYRGAVSLTTLFSRSEAGSRDVHVEVNPSTFQVNDSVWNIRSGSLDYTRDHLSVNDIRVDRNGQYAHIHGYASRSADDVLDIDLKDINLDYIFETLNINYVVFGGDATGSLRASEVFSSHPRIFTDNLRVKGLTYNNSLLGDALLKSWLQTDDMSVHIRAAIDENRRHVADVDGAIYLKRDSLAFNILADSLNIGFMKPFMEAFADDVSGRAKGHAELYGTFKDINLTGKVLADNVKLRIGVTNTEYSATDTVLITPGKIHLDNITLHDRDGHTALLNGYVTHEYFHNPSFKFSITEARDFLCYDTNAGLNPVWYGTIYGSGSGTVTGVPGFIDVLVDMTTCPRSSFTFVIDDSEEAIDYQFLTFTDKRREAEELRLRETMAVRDTVPEFVRRFEQRTHASAQECPTRYRMDLRITATPEAQAVIVMDPAAGDRIRAFGNGALRFTYNSEGEMGLYGKYTIDKGSYNFTLQELIVRDFRIRRGSSINFTGDPLNASLDITAAYRVNASLTDLDKSFATDNDLNRNNVPVEALLKLSGNMQSPDISFDIDLPTLNQDVARKVRSIVSTSDMMNMQMVYLLALNRFYTPDYMNNGGSNNEMASLASATLSTQLGSILGQISDSWSIAPSFRTDKGDFSDMEVDLALSSSLLNNRLIFNGNLGYRDRATSSTTFVGDFDIEYLLNPAGTLRLKAYNHYNDQNYYLRSALTTQGLGIVYKRDFNRFLPGLFRRRRKAPESRPDSTSGSDGRQSTSPNNNPSKTDARQ